MADSKVSFQGVIVSVQPRIRLIRSFDERSHNYLAYALVIRGLVDDDEREFSVGIGKAAQKKHDFCVGDEITDGKSGESLGTGTGHIENSSRFARSL